MTANQEPLWATEVTFHTLISTTSKRPSEYGNCFGVQTSGGEYRVVNFVLENLEALIERGISWPIKILPISAAIGVIHDERIPDEWFKKNGFCEVCCPEHLLPLNQQLRLKRQEARGERIVNHELGFISYNATKKATLPPP